MAQGKSIDRVALRLLRLRAGTRRPAREAAQGPRERGSGPHPDPDGHQGVRRGRRGDHHRVDPHRARRGGGAQDARGLQGDHRLRHLPRLRRTPGGGLCPHHRRAARRRLRSQPHHHDHPGPRPGPAAARGEPTAGFGDRGRPLHARLPAPRGLHLRGADVPAAGREPKIGRHNVCFNCDRTMVKTEVTELRRAYQGDYDPRSASSPRAASASARSPSTAAWPPAPGRRALLLLRRALGDDHPGA